MTSNIYDYDELEIHNDKVECPFCDTVNYDLSKKLDIEKATTAVITCCKCGKEFRADVSIVRETRTICELYWRMKAKPAVCEICGDDDHSKHRLIHNKWVCKFCEDIVLNQQSLAI